VSTVQQHNNSIMDSTKDDFKDKDFVDHIENTVAEYENNVNARFVLIIQILPRIMIRTGLQAVPFQDLEPLSWAYEK
jgi:hypothetical protein